MREVSKQRQLFFDLRDYELPSTIRCDIAQSNGDRGDELASPPISSESSTCDPAVTLPENDVLASHQADGPNSSSDVFTSDARAPVAQPVASLCRRIVQRLPKLHVPSANQDEPLDELHWKLRGLAIPFSFSEDSPSGGRWPASRLDADDIRRLCVLSNLTGKPLNGLLHFAVQTLFEETRSLMSRLVALHEQSGTPLAELLDRALTQPSIACGASESKQGQRSQETERPAERDLQPVHPPSRGLLNTLERPPIKAELAAESPRPIPIGSEECPKAGARPAWDDQCLPQVCDSEPSDISDAEGVNSRLFGVAASRLQAHAPPLVRPDRQLTYDGLPHSEWPRPVEDQQTITIDRLHADIDGPPHRFVIRCGDTVEVFFSWERAELAEVMDVSHAERVVQVRLSGNEAPISIPVDDVFPAAVATPVGKRMVPGPDN
jgi:hypothetical protein